MRVQDHKQELERLFGNHLIFECPMAEYTSFQAGGKADVLCEPGDRNMLVSMVEFLSSKGIPYVTLGNGSNTLVGDKGFEGAVILMRNHFGGIRKTGPGQERLEIGAGCRLKEVLSYCRDEGLGGLEFLAGVPGTIGGAIAMNAGAFGWETGERAVLVEILNRQGDVTRLNRDELEFSYRRFRMQGSSIILSACFELDDDGREVVAKRLASFLKRRKETQPLEFPSAGSVFKNPPGDSAGRLIESVGLKGTKLRGAMISEKHANFIINTGGATAGDILGLIDLARKRVREAAGIELEQEIRVIGGSSVI